MAIASRFDLDVVTDSSMGGLALLLAAVAVLGVFWLVRRARRNRSSQE
jgi:hypothetical protein